MKKKIHFRTPYMLKWLIAVVCALTIQAGKAQVDSYIGAYTGTNKDGYLGPVASVLTSAFNTGQVQHTRIDSNFRVYFHIISTASFILNDKLKHFNGTTPDGFLPVQTTSAPTILGPRESKTVTGINGTAYTFAAGMGAEIISLATPQIALSYGRTELTVRFITADTEGDIGRIRLWGAGLRHDIGQYFMPNDSWILSIGGMYQQIKAGTYLDLGTYNGSITLGQQQRKWHYFIQGGYQSGTLKGEYNHYNGETYDRISFNLKNKNPIFFGAGIGLNIGILQLQLQASGYEPVVGSFALGFKF